MGGGAGAAKPKGKAVAKSVETYYSTPQLNNYYSQFAHLNAARATTAAGVMPANMMIGSHGANAPTSTSAEEQEGTTSAAETSLGVLDKNHYRRAREALIKAAREYNAYQQTLKQGSAAAAANSTDEQSKTESSGSEMVSKSSDKEADADVKEGWEYLSAGSHQAAAPGVQMGARGGALLHRPAAQLSPPLQLPTSILKGVTVDLTSQTTPTLI